MDAAIREIVKASPGPVGLVLTFISCYAGKAAIDVARAAGLWYFAGGRARARWAAAGEGPGGQAQGGKKGV
ncbi:hypothetical protein BDV18DRAFT_157773 [Aspergillus unguis]